MKVSVCITTYNLEDYVSKCLDSVLSQKTDFDYEILVGDDCSTDNTLKILKSYELEYPEKIKVIYHPKNIGVNANDYSLIMEATGKYIAWCDGDDYWVDDYKLQKQVNFLESRPNFSCVHTSWINFDEESGAMWRRNIEPHEWENRIYGNIYIENLLCSRTTGCRFSSILYRRNHVLEYLKNNNDIYLKVPHYQNDLAVFCILSSYGLVGYLNDFTTVYRIRKRSLSHSDQLYNKIKYQIGVLHLYSYFINRHKLSRNCRQAAMRKPLSVIIPYACIMGNTSIIEEIDMVCKTTNYRYRIGQYVIVKSFCVPFLRKIIGIWLKRRVGFYE